MFKYHLGIVFKQLRERDDLALEELAQIEWPFARLLTDEMLPLSIHRVLQRDPSFFALLVSFLYKRDDGTVDREQGNITDERRQQMRENAREVLRTWHQLPGLGEDGSMDAKTLLDWVEAARTQCAETQHVTGGDLELAKILARSPSDPDGAWPHSAVRNVIEKLQNPVVDQHIAIAVHNNRGVTSRGSDEGGRQERVLARRYEDMAKIVASKWPRTSAILNAISKSYYSAATLEDTLTDLHDLSWN